FSWTSSTAWTTRAPTSRDTLRAAVSAGDRARAPDDARAVRRMTALTQEACPRCGTDNPAVAKFCMACGTPLSGTAGAAPAGLRFVTVAFCDIGGSTELALRLQPEV